MTKTLNQIIFFSSTKIRIFFSATLGISNLFHKINACWHQREIIRRKNYIIQLTILASLNVYTTDWELHLLVINLKGSIYYFINNIWYKYAGITKQKEKYLMADKKLRRKLTENWRLSNPNTTKTPDRHELRCCIWVWSSNFTNATSWEKELGEIILHGHLEKLMVKTNLSPTPFFSPH
jgi:hypothetical protein